MESERAVSATTPVDALGDVVCLGGSMALFVACPQGAARRWWQTFGGAVLLHLSGITPVLSAGCRELVDAALTVRPRDMRISFDINWRPSLWRAAGPDGVQDSAELLREFADRTWARAKVREGKIIE